MTARLLDTTILSELRRLKPDRKVLAFVTAQPLETPACQRVSRLVAMDSGLAQERAPE